MTTFISMLRGINVGKQKRISMAELIALYESLGLVNVETYVQSGNLVFDSSEREASNLAGQLEALIEQSFGLAVSVFIRDTQDFERLIDSNPFLIERNEDPAKLHVTFLYNSPSKEEKRSLDARGDEADEIYVTDREIFLFCPNGYGGTKFSNAFFERKLKVRATTRNWNTVSSLYRLVQGR